MHSKKVRDKPEKEKDSNNKRDKESKLNWSLPDKSNLLRNKQVLVNKLELKERTT